jgi:lipopolysaccharide export system protein LptC
MDMTVAGKPVWPPKTSRSSLGAYRARYLAFAVMMLVAWLAALVGTTAAASIARNQGSSGDLTIQRSRIFQFDTDGNTSETTGLACCRTAADDWSSCSRQ